MDSVLQNMLLLFQLLEISNVQPDFPQITFPRSKVSKLS